MCVPMCSCVPIVIILFVFVLVMIQAFESLLFGEKPATEKRKRDSFKKLVGGIVGVSAR